MHIPSSLLSLLASLSLLLLPLPHSAAVPSSPHHRREPFKDLVLTDIYTNSFRGGEVTTWNRRITFHLFDLNSSTKTCCTASWTESSSESESESQSSSNDTTSTAPMTTYIFCDATGLQESFGWHFTSYTGLDEFSLRLRHSFDDPVKYPPPYSVLTVFADVNVTLSCVEKAGLKGCTLPVGTAGVRAPVNAAVL